MFVCFSGRVGGIRREEESFVLSHILLCLLLFYVGIGPFIFLADSIHFEDRSAMKISRCTIRKGNSLKM